MKAFFFGILVSIYCLKIIGNNLNQPDQKHSDSIRLENIYKIVDEYSSTNELLFEKYNEEYRCLAKKFNSNYHLGAVERRYSNYYKKKQNYQRALEHSFRALDYDQLANEHLSITEDYVDIAGIFVKTEQYSKAFETYNKTILYYSKMSDYIPFGIGMVELGKSELYFIQKKMRAAELEIEKSLINLNKTSNEIVEFNNKDYREPYLLDALILQFTIKSKLNKFSVCNSIAKKIEKILANKSYFSRSNKYILSKTDFDFRSKGEIDISKVEGQLRIEKKEGMFQNVISYYALLKEYSIQKSLFENALEYADSLEFYKAKIYDSEKTDAITKYQAKFETKKAEYEKKIAEEETQRAHLKVWLTSGLLVLTLIILVLIGINLRNKKKSHKQKMVLKDLKIDELLKNNELENLHGILSGQEIERKRIAQDLHDTIGGMLATVKLHFNRLGVNSNFENKELEIFENTDKLLDESCKEVRRVSHDLNEGSIASFGLNQNLKNLKNAIELSNTLKLDIIFENVDLKNKKEIEIEVFKIIQELISNTLKHAKADEINIQISQFEDTLQVIFEDNGIGFNINKIKRGIGLNSIQKRTGKLKGSLQIDSHQQRGSTFIFEIPL